MEGVGGDVNSTVAPLAKWKSEFSRAFQYYLDRSTPHIIHRWLGTVAAATIYVLRVYYVEGFYIVSYGLGIYILNLLIGFLSPKVDPELELMDGASLPTKGSDEFRPFIRRLPEFKFWYTSESFLPLSGFMTFLFERKEFETFQAVVSAFVRLPLGSGKLFKVGYARWKRQFIR